MAPLISREITQAGKYLVSAHFGGLWFGGV
jgi:hypothetical protein